MTDDEDERKRISRRRMIVAGTAGVTGVLATAGVVRALDGGGASAGTTADGEAARDFPLSSILPASYTAGEDDVAAYVRRAVERLEPLGRASILLPPGRHRWDSPCYFAADTTDLTYELRGQGRGTVLELGPGLRDEFAIHLNEDADGRQAVAFPRHPRLRVSDLSVTATAADIGASLCRSNQASVDLTRIRFRYVKYGVTVEGYTDLMAFRQIGWEAPATDGRLYLMTGTGGDGLVMDQITANGDAVVADLVGCNGGTLTSCIGGRFLFTDCDAIEMVAAHFDSHGADNAPLVQDSFVVIRGSRVTVRGGWDHVGPNAPAFEIDDSEADRYSEVTWDGWSFGFRVDAADKERAPDVAIRAVQPNTKLRFRNCSSRLLPSGMRSRWPVGPRLESDAPDVRAAIDAAPTAPLENAELVRTGTGWAFSSSDAPVGFAQPTIERCAETDAFPGDLRPGTSLYYAVAPYSSFSRGRPADGPRSAEARTTVRGTGRAVALDVTLGAPRGGIRVWRGSAPGAYDAYADLPVGGFTTRLIDTGGYLCGQRWARDNVPPAPPEGGAR